VVEVNGSAPFRTAAEFLSFAKANPGKVKVAYAGNGTPQHVGIELFKSMAGVSLTLVPYLGSAPALADLLEGRVDMMFDPMPSSIGYIRSGKLLPLATTSPTRSEALANIPAMSEFVPGYEAGSGSESRTAWHKVSSSTEQATRASIDDPAVRPGRTGCHSDRGSAADSGVRRSRDQAT
jgi:tripartite-type tricarboxylate transporter receptor subunit TctC